MKERLSILLGVLAAAYLVWGVFTPRISPNSIERPLSTEAGPNGYLGLQRWLEQSGVSTHSLRERLTALTEPSSAFARPGHVLITVMPHHVHPNRDEMNALLDWVSEGNTLVILAGFNDTPRWTYAANIKDFVADFAYLTSLRAIFRTADKDDRGTKGDNAKLVRIPEPQKFELAALPGHWLTDNVHELAAISDLLTGQWNIEPDPGAPAFLIAREPAGNVDALLITDLGKGAIVVSTFASLWQNSVIGKRDNRQLVVNLLRHHLGPGGSVIFDDYHHGLTNAYDAGAFFSDPRLAWTGVFLLGFWVLYAVFSDSRLGRPTQPGGAPSHTDFVRTLGRFLARKVSRRDAGLRLVENFLAHVRPHLTAGPEASVWQRVVAVPRMDEGLAKALGRDHARLQAGRTVDLQELQRRLRAARRAFS